MSAGQACFELVPSLMLSLVGPGSRRRPEEDLDEQFLVGAAVAGSG
ncbi:hypothetical protein [Prochlorococcus marinus]|nr:hypothetical protein [Prochlorococcus marinus]